MAESSTSHGGVSGVEADESLTFRGRGLFTKLLVAEGGLIASILALGWLGGVFANQQMTLVGFLVGILTMMAILLAMVIVVGTLGFAAWQGARLVT